MPVDARVVVVQLFGIETEQDVHFVARPCFGLINFVVFHERFGKVADGREVRVFIDDGRVERGPWMLVEPAADHLAVLRPFVVGVESGVDADKTLSVVFDEGQHVFLLAVVEVEFAGGAHKNQGIEVVEVLRVSVRRSFLVRSSVSVRSVASQRPLSWPML